MIKRSAVRRSVGTDVATSVVIAGNPLRSVRETVADNRNRLLETVARIRYTVAATCKTVGGNQEALVVIRIAAVALQKTVANSQVRVTLPRGLTSHQLSD